MENVKTKRINFFILIAIILVAIFFRTYHFESLLSFQLDQSRDAIIVGDFVREGMKKIPLLGPHISGSTLQLGPAYYYLQAIPAFFLGTGPVVFALSDWFFSILFVPLLYFFLRLYFPRTISLFLSAIAATSLFLVVYGRFAWNPNSLPFFTLLALLGLLKADWKNVVRPGWFYIAIGSAAIATQLHYVYFFMAPLLFGVYLAVWRPRLRVKHYLIAILLIFIVYAPEIISEIKTEASNTKLLIKNTLERVPSEEKHNVAEKTFYAWQKLEIVNWQILTSDEHGSSVALSKKFLPTCNRQCKKDFPYLAVQTIVFLLGIWISVSAYRREPDRNRKKYIFSAWLWLALMFIISIPIIYKMSPYYYLAAIPPLFVFWGMILKKIKISVKKYGMAIVVFISIVIIFFNLRQNFRYLKEHQALLNGEVENIVGREFYDDRKVTLGQMEKVAEYIKKNRHSEAPVKIAVDNTFGRALFYLLSYERSVPACYIKTSSFHPSGNSDYFLVYRLSVNEHMPQDLDEFFSIRHQKKFGNLLVIDAQAKNPDNGPYKDEPCYTF